MNLTLLKPRLRLALGRLASLAVLGLAGLSQAQAAALDLRLEPVAPAAVAGSFTALLDERVGGAVLNLPQTGLSGARITRIFVQDLDGAIPTGVPGQAPAITLTGRFEEGLSYDLRLDSGGANKLAVVKIVKDFTGLGLKESKDLVDAAPVVVAHAISAADRDSFAQALAEAGATVTAVPLNEFVGLQINLPYKEVVTAYDVLLTTGGANKLAVVKIVKDATGLGLKESKDLVDAAPSIIKAGLDAASAANLRQALIDAGAGVTLNPVNGLVSQPIELPGGSHALDAIVALVPDYKGHASSPDLSVGLPLAGSFADLAASVASRRFVVGVELSSVSGSGLYLLAPVPEPEAVAMWLGGLLTLLAWRRRVAARG